MIALEEIEEEAIECVMIEEAHQGKCLLYFCFIGFNSENLIINFYV